MTSNADPVRIVIGTAGYSYDEWRKGVYYPRGLKHDDELSYYSGTLSGCEINSSFHGIPRESTFQKWASTSKQGFLFSLKVPQEITHLKRLEDISDTWHFFINRARENLGGKIGPVLFQLPPSLKVHLPKLKEIGMMVSEVKDCKVAFEFRDRSWYCNSVYSIMREYNMAICENISPDGSAIKTEEVTADWCYTRFHKNSEHGETCYTDGALQNASRQIIQRYNDGISQFIYFMNDIGGHGPKNAKSLMNILQPKLPNAPKGLSPGWKPKPVIEKGGAGSISGMFANIKNREKMQTSTSPSKSSSTSGIVGLSSQKRSAVVGVVGSSPSKKLKPNQQPPKKVAQGKGSIASFFKRQ